mmetsp:Transcript_21023/g.49623  ORF Transcript_21023/g.49623 Transcript_21023/m.49623 type:complete len:530 (+) Transcript_21023:71-1660(+)
MMKTIIAFLALLSIADATGSLRGESELQGPSLTCTLQGGTSQSQCDATASDDGSTCVWCSLSTYGVCVDESIAVQMKATIPGLSCDDGDDDDTPAPSDDDDAPSDDSLPDDYWDCIKKFDTKDGCLGGGCAWCSNDFPYGVCMDAESAKNYDDHLFFTCDFPSLGTPVLEGKAAATVQDPKDLSCLIASSDQSNCEVTKDAVGQPCEWCSIQGFPVCMTNDQARFAEEVGGSCGDRASNDLEVLDDPYDPSCLFLTIMGDESSCREATDVDGNPCEWCSLQGIDVCANGDQADFVQEAGGSCSASEESTPEHTELVDPYDPSCLLVTLEQDSSLCKQAVDSEGNSCEWCSLQGFEVCVNAEQAEIAEEAGGSCGKGQTLESAELSDPLDPNCLVLSLLQDEDTCREFSDKEGNPCEWCNIVGYGICMNSDQADLAEQIVGTCDEGTAAHLANGKALSDPYDPNCILMTLEQDESGCKGAMDSDGKPCQWCSLQGYEFCVNEDQAQIVEQTGASCGDNAVKDQGLFASTI